MFGRKNTDPDLDEVEELEDEQESMITTIVAVGHDADGVPLTNSAGEPTTVEVEVRRHVRSFLVNRVGFRVEIDKPADATPDQVDALFVAALCEACVNGLGEIKPGSGVLKHQGDRRYEWKR